MAMIKYLFSDGSKKEIEVSDEFAQEYFKLEKEERRIERKETRRHVSLEGLEEKGIPLAAKDSDPYEMLDKEDCGIPLLECLNAKQREVVIKYVFEKMSKTEIAQELNIDESAVRRRLERGLKTLKELYAEKHLQKNATKFF